MAEATAEVRNNGGAGKSRGSDILIGMKAIKQALNDVSESTILKWHKESALPIKKNGDLWTGSKANIEAWWREFTK